MLWIIRDTNYEATKYYLDILEKAFVHAQQEVKQVDSVNYIKAKSNDDIYLVTTLIDAVKVYISGKRKIIIWFQGAFSEESYMKHKSKLRKIVLGQIEKYILNKALFIFFVSDEMKRYYTERYKVDVKNKCYVMPCFNTTINKESIMKKDKYINNVFCYAGSMSIWQGFEKILACYKKIEDLGVPNTEFLILTKEKEEAQKLAKKAGIKKYSIDYVPLDSLDRALAQAKFGFILRDNIIVNRVATPTKISTYMANGLIPIYSDCLVDFHENAKEIRYKVSFDQEDFIEAIKSFMVDSVDSSKVYEDYKKLFDSYYNEEYHIENIARNINCLLGSSNFNSKGRRKNYDK